VPSLLGSRCHCGEAAIEKARRRVGGAKVEPPQSMGSSGRAGRQHPIRRIMDIGFLSFWGKAMAGVREVRVTTIDGRQATVRVEYDEGVTQVIFADQLSMPSPLEPAAAKIQVANQLKKLAIDLQDVEPDQIIIEWTPA
jgi:hypothetical protein